MVCHNCRIDCARHGRDRYGHQRYQCRQCRKTFQDARPKLLGGMYLPINKAETILKMLVEGCSVRTIERLTDVNRDTILRLLVLAGAKCERLLSEKIRAVPVSDVQVDELWGFCYCKEKRKPTDSPLIGDSWCYVGIERESKLILAWHLGRRTAEHTLEFTEKCAGTTGGCVTELRRVPILVCSYCQERIALPHRNLQGKLPDQSYWPTDSETITFLCPDCGHLSVYWETDVLWGDVPKLDPGERPNVFLRVEFLCDRGNCGLLIVLHTIAEQGVSRYEVAERVAKAIPVPTCANGHALSPGQHIPEPKVVD